MKTKIIFFTVVFLLCIAHTGNTQNTLQINKQDGSKVTTTIGDIRKITFPSGNLAITKYDGSVITYVLTDVKYINFTTVYTSLPNIDANSVLALRLFPNPVVNELLLNLGEINITAAKVSVLNSAGVEIFSKSVTNQPTIRFDVSALSQGVYFCVVKSGETTLAGKFIK